MPQRPPDYDWAPTAAPDENPLWLQRRRANKASSRLYQLPEELVLAILQHADEVTTQLARCSCSLLLRLVASEDAQSQSRFSTGPWGIWPPHQSQEDYSWVPAFCTALRRDSIHRYCMDCRNARESGAAREAYKRSMQALKCSHCFKKHPRVWFSPAQRRMPDALRACIKRWASVRVCEHVTVPCPESVYGIDWPDVGEYEVRRCLHWSHLSPGQGRRPWLAHAVLYAKELLRVRKASKEGREGEEGEEGTDPYPRVVGSRGRYLKFFWTGHIFDLDPAVPVTRSGLRDSLARVDPKCVRRMGLCAHVVQLGDGQLALPFEQSRCACFDGRHGAAAAPIADGHSLYHDHQGWGQRTCCRCLADRDGGFVASAEGIFMPSGPDAAGQDHARCHSYECPLCASTYTWVRKGRQMHLESVRTFLNDGFGAYPRWIPFVDPIAWGIQHDDELRHVVWCDRPHCETSSRYAVWTDMLARDPLPYEDGYGE